MHGRPWAGRPTTLAVEDPDMARLILEWYSSRWLIEQMFRPMKKKGFAITEKLRNPYPRERLGWEGWVIARLGGWKGCGSQRPVRRADNT